jgi:hypothetical protein
MWAFALPLVRGPSPERATERADEVRGDDGIRTRDPHLGNWMVVVSCVSTVSAVPLSCTFLAPLSHVSHQIAGVDSISFVISLV